MPRTYRSRYPQLLCTLLHAAVVLWLSVSAAFAGELVPSQGFQVDNPTVDRRAVFQGRQIRSSTA
ncbi:MAG: hypothetical protein KDD44_01135, partial [Bdellovibrionales bacterium]|nr:hypothetical protein [Bdellovibrionales bacterium]